MLQAVMDYRYRKKAIPVIRGIIEDFLDEDCDFLASQIEKHMKAMNIPFKRRVVVTVPPEQDLGHVNSKNQFGHNVVEIGGRIFDPDYSNEALPPEEYLSKAYKPQDGVKVVFTS